MFAPKAFLVAFLALGAAADNCYYCSWASYGNPEGPTYECGDKCGYKYYSTSQPNWHCWKSTHAMNKCFKDCCKKAGKVPSTSNCDVLGTCW